MIAGTLTVIAARWRMRTGAVAVAWLLLSMWAPSVPPAWRLVPAALADGDSGGHGGGEDGGDHGGNSGPGGGDDGGDDDHSGPGGGDDEGDDGDDDGGSGNSQERGGARDHVRDEVVVANLTESARSDVGRLGFIVLDEQNLPSLDLTVTRLRVPRQMTALAARSLLAARIPDVVVDLNAIYRPQGPVVLPPRDYATKLIGATDVPAGCGQGLRIGLLDTAVDAATPALRGAHIQQRTFLPAGTVPAPTDHGTAIAAILVGQAVEGSGPGLLPNADLAVAEVFAADSSGIPVADVIALVRAFDWFASARTPVLNLSFSGGANALVSLALRRVSADGMTIVAAAGNDGPTAPPAFPAAEPTVLAVTAIDSRSAPYAAANRGDYIDFAAPGVRVWTPGPTPAGSYNTGTSFATPFVTAAAAVRLAAGGAANPGEIADTLARTAIDLGAPGKDPIFGWGLIQLAGACSQPSQ